jgi:hypothetical protein
MKTTQNNNVVPTICTDTMAICFATMDRDQLEKIAMELYLQAERLRKELDEKNGVIR